MFVSTITPAGPCYQCQPKVLGACEHRDTRPGPAKRESLNRHVRPESRGPRFKSEGLATRRVDGGAKGIRTPDLLNAIQTLSQLSYSPTAGAGSIPPEQVVSRLARAGSAPDSATGASPIAARRWIESGQGSMIRCQ
jgi:hypothetical protein